MSAKNFSLAQYGAVSDSSSTGLYIGSIAYAYGANKVDLKDHTDSTVGFTLADDKTDVTLSGAVVAKTTGLVPAIAQCVETGDILMMAWMNAESLSMTFAEGRMVYYSRSRSELWRKGDTSGDRQFVREAYYDCDGDTLLFKVEQEGKGACHTGNFSCFFTSFGSND